MRVFFALWPEPAVQQQLAQWAHAARAVSEGRSPRTENLHVTLAFLGEVDAGHCTALAAIPGSFGTEPFELVFDRLEYWRHNRIVYAAVSEMPAALTALAGRLRQRLSHAGFRTESRDFVPHVTLLRDARRAPDDVQVEPVVWKVGALRLVETTRTHDKAAYRLLQCWTLGD